MIDLAQTYLGCSKNQLAATLNRDPAKIVPDSGNPKLDMVMGISDVLDWPAGDVAEALWIDPVTDEPTDSEFASMPFEELNRESITAHRAGDHRRMRRIAAQMVRIAQTPVERAKAANRMAGAFERAGRYGRALEWAKRAAFETGVPASSHHLYLANLASLNYLTWNLHEAASLASLVLTETDAIGWDDLLGVGARCIAGWVSGNSRRRLMSQLPERVKTLAPIALRDLERAIRELRELATRRGDESCNAIANTCVGAVIEVEVVTGSLAAVEAADRLLNGLNAVIDPANHPQGDWLESWGWWSVFGLNISTKFIEGDSRQRLAAIFSTKAHEIADRLENWAMREQVFTLEHEWKLSPCGSDASERKEWLLDREDLRTLVGTMGRFPWFRQTGWRILEAAKLI